MNEERHPRQKVVRTKCHDCGQWLKEFVDREKQIGDKVGICPKCGGEMFIQMPKSFAHSFKPTGRRVETVAQERGKA